MIRKSNQPEIAYRLAYKYEQTKEHCSQCTLAAIMESLDWIDEDLFQAIDGLTGGTALSTNGTCGALAAGIVAISKLTGRTYTNFKKKAPGHTWKYIHQLYDRFIEKYGGPNGYQVQERFFGTVYSLRDPESRESFTQAGAHIDKCPSVCADVAKWSVEIILQINEGKEI